MYKDFGVVTFQAEDEIAAITSAIGAAYAGAIGLTTTSGPGMALKTEALGLAVAVELPLVICDVQRGGPSTGLPTKTEQADLLQALFGRNSEAPIPVLAPCTPGDCFWIAFEAVRIAIKYMVPVIFFLTAISRTARNRGTFHRLPIYPKFPFISKPIPWIFSRTAATRKRSRDPGRFPARRVSNIASAAWKSRKSPAM